MDILKNLFYGFPDLWGGGVAHSVLILALVITLGLSLGKLRVKGVSLGLAWILFIGLIFGHRSSEGCFPGIGLDSLHRPHLRSLLSQSR